MDTNFLQQAFSVFELFDFIVCYLSLVFSFRCPSRLYFYLHVLCYSITLITFKDEEILPKETKQEGAVSLNTYLHYFKSLHSLGAALFVILLFAVTQVSTLFHF